MNETTINQHGHDPKNRPAQSLPSDAALFYGLITWLDRFLSAGGQITYSNLGEWPQQAVIGREVWGEGLTLFMTICEAKTFQEKHRPNFL